MGVGEGWGGVGGWTLLEVVIEKTQFQVIPTKCIKLEDA